MGEERIGGWRERTTDVAETVADRLRYWRFRIAGEMPVRIGPYTVRVDVTDYLGDYREVTVFEEHEAAETADLLAELGSDDVVLDVGANIGLHALFAGLVADRVYAIEPHPVNAAHLLRNRNKNATAVTQFGCALSDEAGYIELAAPRGGSIADGSVALAEIDPPTKAGPSDGGTNPVAVRAERGDALIEREGLDPPTVVKIDVEGAEDRVIDGLSETLADSACRLLYCELHQDRVDEAAVVTDLESAGFTLESIDDRPNVRTVKGRK